MGTSLTAVFVAVVLAGGVAQPKASASAVSGTTQSGPITLSVGTLQVKLIVEHMMGKNLPYVVLSNDSNEFVCLSERELNPAYQHMRLTGPHGEKIPLTEYVESSRTSDLGFNFRDAYLFVRPHERRRIAIDLSPFAIRHSGSYAYTVRLIYYPCGDIIDKARIRSRKQVKTFSVSGSGSISWPSEK